MKKALPFILLGAAALLFCFGVAALALNAHLNGTWQANGDPARTSEERRTEADSDQRYGASGAAQLSTVAFVLPSSSARTSDSR